jgi:hypothetical protein
VHIKLSARTRSFTVLGNEVLRDRRLSFTARGILGFLLSLPDGAREDVRTLADKNPGIGRRGVAKAVDELVALGYYVRRTVRDEDSGQVRTETYVFDTPQAAGEPLPVPAGTGQPVGGRAGRFPKGKKNPEEVPSLPEPATPPNVLGAPGAALLSGLTRAEPRLALSAADLLALAPLAAPWLEAGVPEREARALLTDGLPPVIHSARAILADRLTRKLPAPRATVPAFAVGLAECGTCRDPLPRGRRTGICAACSGIAPAPQRASPAASFADHVATVRALVRTAARPQAVARG